MIFISRHYLMSFGTGGTYVVFIPNSVLALSLALSGTVPKNRNYALGVLLKLTTVYHCSLNAFPKSFYLLESTARNSGWNHSQ